ncbi:Endoribonuclease L-PSP/chorismate mutase-like protein [Abortiporus biennis]|nr:Endoribonuclease L-PSP/chorismate mutase-like protein [Abortiporus biennis]
MAKVLRAAGSGLEQVIKISVYLTDMTNFAAMNEVYIEFFDRNAMPARTCVAVKGLPLDAAVEIECVAEIPDSA